MLDLVIDTGVLMIASNKSDQPCQEWHTELLNHVTDNEVVFLALDREGHVKSEYEAKLRHGTIGMEWLRLLLTRGKVQWYNRGRLPKGMRVKLSEKHFDSGDSSFVRLVIATQSRQLVTEDDDYSPAVCTILRKERSVIVHQTHSACDYIRANHPTGPTVCES